MSSIVLVSGAGPALEPVSLAEARAHSRLSGNDEDANLAGYLMAARQHVENYTGRALISRSYDLSIDSGWPLVNWEKRIILPLPPLVSVTSVKYLDTSGVQQTLSSALYQVTLGDMFGEIVPAYGAAWPGVRCQRDAVVVRFVTGYGSNPGDVPEPIRQAILLLTAHYFENREGVVLGSAAAELPLGVCALLANYRTSLL